MDALTNVVAVLILVLILVQADVSQKVVEFLEGLKPATPEQVEASQKKAEALKQKKEEIADLLQQEAPTEAAVEKETRQLALLEKSLKENRELLADLEDLKKLEKKTRTQRDQEAEKTQKIQTEIERLKALLDDTPILKADPTIVSIPTSRAVPRNAEIYHALVIHDRVHFIDPFTPVELFEEEFKKNRRNFPYQRIKRQGADRYVFEPQPIVNHFKDFDFQNSRKQKVVLVAYPTGVRMHIVVTPDHKLGGTSLAELEQPTNRFAGILKKLSRNSNAVVFFHVHPNSFNTYLQARRLVDQANVSAGWEVKGMASYAIRIDEVEIKRQKPPPPAKPNPDRPPVLPPKLD